MAIFSTLAADVRYALRGFRKNPTFTAVSIASLALGIGVNTAIFNLVSAVLLRPLPVPESARLMSIYTEDRTNPGFLSCSYPNYKDFRDHNTVFSGLALFSSFPINFTGTAEPEELEAQIVSGNYFDVLGVKPAIGRTFLPQEDRTPGANPVTVISYGFWMRRFAGSHRALGAVVGLNNHPFMIVGVAPKEFHGTNALINADFWVPMMMYQQIFPLADWFLQRRALLFTPIGRLNPGVQREEAEAALKILAARLEQEYPSDNKGRTVVVIPLTQALIHPKYREGFVLASGIAMGAAALVLLIACANVGNLMLVRAAGRRDEMALRLTLGVTPGRLIGQLLTESMLLSLFGGAAALVLARWTRDLLWTARPPSLAVSTSPSLDFRVLGFTLLISLVAGLIFGLAPALSAVRGNLATEMRERHSPWKNAGSKVSFRSILVMGQVALAVVALSCAGLFLRSLDYARRINPGFDAEHLAEIPLNLKAQDLSADAGRQFYGRIVDKVVTLPGVADATLASNPPFSARARSFSVEGQSASAGPGMTALINVVEPGYFQAVRIPLLRGRSFAETDTPTSPRVALVNETMASRFWSGRDPSGQRLRFFGDSAPVEIVGVVRDSAYLSLGEAPRFMVYLCLRQSYTPSVTLYVRTHGEPGMALSGVRREVQALDSRLVLSEPESMPQVIHESLWAPRLGAILFAAFGALAAVLTVVGLYGVISYSVGQRTRELGIRMALGARPQDVLIQVLGEGGVMIACGLFVGLFATLTVTGILTSLLFGVSAHDPLTLGGVVVALLVPTLTACLVPALRATRIDPILALRDE